MGVSACICEMLNIDHASLKIEPCEFSCCTVCIITIETDEDDSDIEDVEAIEEEEGEQDDSAVELHCRVVDGFKDDVCGRIVEKGHAGLCK